MTAISSMLKALADPTRLRILNILSYCDICVCELQSVLGVSQPFLSRHLAYLRNAGLVRDRRDGARVYYSLARELPRVEVVRTFLQQVLPADETSRDDLEKLTELLKSKAATHVA